jgi:hypothetical protein
LRIAALDASLESMPDATPIDLVRHVVTSTGLPAATSARVIADVIAYFDETIEQYVRRRHFELRQCGVHNDAIWPAIVGELTARPVRAGTLTERQLRRIVYG